MSKTIGFIAGLSAYLFTVASAFAADVTSIPLSPPPGSIGTVDIAQVPQFLISLLFVAGIVIAIAFLIYGGIKWVLSGGDKTAVEGARNHIVAAIVGLIIIAGAFFIINVVFTLLTGRPFDLNHLCIPNLTNPTCN